LLINIELNLIFNLDILNNLDNLNIELFNYKYLLKRVINYIVLNYSEIKVKISEYLTTETESMESIVEQTLNIRKNLSKLIVKSRD
jgi:hypothetical protein